MSRERIPLRKRVVIVEDDPGIRESYKIIISSAQQKYEVVGVYGDMESFLKIALRVLPDIVLLDIGLPGMSGVEGTLRLKKILPYVEIIMITVYEDSSFVFESLKNGASGYISKSSNYMEILNALDEINRGGAPMSSHIARTLVSEFQASVHNPLTKRETEVLQLISRGKTYTQIADELQVSKETTKAHTRNIYRKLHANKKSEAISIGLERRIITR